MDAHFHPSKFWRAFALILGFATLVAATDPAHADTVDPFIGTYVGTAQVFGDDGAVTETRDMDITIVKESGGGFRITWINVTRIDGRRDVVGVRRRVDEVVLQPGDRDGVFLEKTRRSLFERRQKTDVISGDPLRWGRIDGNRLGLFSLLVTEGGGYALQSYERILTEDGMDIEFSRIEDGTLIRRITGRTVRVD